mgnify:CR=1 FL=1
MAFATPENFSSAVAFGVPVCYTMPESPLEAGVAAGPAALAVAAGGF